MNAMYDVIKSVFRSFEPPEGKSDIGSNGNSISRSGQSSIRSQPDSALTALGCRFLFGDADRRE